MAIRAIKKEDLEELSQVMVKAYDDGWTPSRSKAYLEKFYNFEPGCCQLVEEDGKVLGAILGYSYYKRETLVLFIQELFVDPDCRHKGYAKELIVKLRSMFEDNHMVKITPQVNAPSGVLNFYNSIGFEKEQIYSFYDQNEAF